MEDCTVPVMRWRCHYILRSVSYRWYDVSLCWLFFCLFGMSFHFTQKSLEKVKTHIQWPIYKLRAAYRYISFIQTISEKPDFVFPSYGHLTVISLSSQSHLTVISEQSHCHLRAISQSPRCHLRAISQSSRCPLTFISQKSGPI